MLALPASTSKTRRRELLFRYDTCIAMRLFRSRHNCGLRRY
jgi:hypothetical protein